MKNILDNILVERHSTMKWAEYQLSLKKVTDIDSCKKPILEKPKSRSSVFNNYLNIPLAPDTDNFHVSILEAIMNRKSSYEFAGIQPLNFTTISNLLSLSYFERIDGNGKRNIASAGALYPIDVYVHFNKPICGSINKHLYYYDVANLSLRELNMRHEDHGLIEKAFEQKTSFSESSCHIFLTLNLHDVLEKYGEKGYQNALFEVGQIGHSFNLIASALNLPCLTVCGFDGKVIDDVLLLDGVLKSTVYCIFIGNIN